MIRTSLHGTALTAAMEAMEAMEAMALTPPIHLITQVIELLKVVQMTTGLTEVAYRWPPFLCISTTAGFS